MIIDKEKTQQSFAFGFLVLFGVFLVYELAGFIDAFLGAIIMYVLFRPIMQYLTIRRAWNKNFSAILILLVSFLSIILPILGLSYVFISKLSTLFNDTSVIMPSINSANEKIQSLIGVEVLSEQNIQSLQQKATEIVTQFLGETLSVTADIGIMYFLLFYFLIYTGEMEKRIIKILPFNIENIGLLSHELSSMTYSNVLGAPLLATIQGLFAVLGFWITDVPQPIFWGMMCGVFSFIPFVGSALIWLPVSGFLLGKGMQWQGITMVLYGFLVIGSIDNIFRFIIQKKIADVHPLITILGVIIGLQMFGLPGIIFGPLLISYFLLLISMYRKEYNLKKD